VIIIDRLLEDRHRQGNPIRVGMVGAGFMGHGIALQIVQATKGIELVAIANRHPDRAVHAYREAGVDNPQTVGTVSALESAIAASRPAITDNPNLLCEARAIDAIIEVTGAVEYSAKVALAAIANGKHLILMNAELDATVGPILKAKADAAGVVITNADGDQPGVTLNLYRFVVGIGVTPVLCGNIKGLHDPYRNPTTQAAFARRWGQSPTMVTSFADGTKISFEQAIVANATGMRVAKRGMLGPVVPAGTPVSQTMHLFPLEESAGVAGIVDYVVGAEPAPGVFVVGIHTNPRQRHYLDLYKLGDGPFYCFYRPFHLCHFEVPNSIARAVLFQDATITPIGRPYVDVVAAAKQDLRRGDVIDGLGGYHTYGIAENADLVSRNHLLPMGLAEGCRLKNAIRRDGVLTYHDIEMPGDRVVAQLRAEQDERFAVAKPGGNNTPASRNHG
jgi:predicted homoserine dehydrogenase-like protein